jgi:hypothetical protein
MSSHEPPTVHAPDLFQPVIGFRQWRMAENGLLSITGNEIWCTPTLHAQCRAGSHPQEPAPASACSCGVHAWYEPCPRTASAPTWDYIAGAVVLWGAIELHVQGMRAQHCRIVALALPLSRWGKRDRAIDVAERLGIPAVRHRDLSAIAKKHGAPVPAALRPPPGSLAASRAPIGSYRGSPTRQPPAMKPPAMRSGRLVRPSARPPQDQGP